MSLLLCLLTVLRKSSLWGIFFNFKGGKQVYGVAATTKRPRRKRVANLTPTLPSFGRNTKKQYYLAMILCKVNFPSRAPNFDETEIAFCKLSAVSERRNELSSIAWPRYS